MVHVNQMIEHLVQVLLIRTAALQKPTLLRIFTREISQNLVEATVITITKELLEAQLIFKQENQTNKFKENGNSLVEFQYNLTLNPINMFNISIQKQADGASTSFIKITGIDLTAQHQTKTAYMKRILNGTGVCVKDQE